MSYNTNVQQKNISIHFQQELIQQVLLENGVIRPEHIQKAIEIQKKYISEGKQKLELLSYYVDQKNYCLYIKNPITDELITEVSFPIRKKNKPEFNSTDWFPIAVNSVAIFSNDDCQEVGELNWNPNDQIGLTIGKNFSYLQMKSTDDSFYFPVLSKLHYESTPSEAIVTLPIDLTVTNNKKNLYFVDRGAGILYIFDTETNKLSGAVHLRPAGNKRTLNVSSTNDGKKIFVTDNETPGMFIIEAKTLKIKKQPLSYGNLCNLISDDQWLYILVDKGNNPPELLVLDTQNLILRANIQLKGELFSKIDDPTDLMVLSPSGKYLLVMTFVNYPALFTPIVNVIDLNSFQLVDQIFLNDTGKPTYISFAMQKPEELVKLKSGLIDILIELGYINEEHVLAALDKINGIQDDYIPEVQNIIQEPLENEEGFGLLEKEMDDDEEQTLTSAQKYPILYQFELDPSLLLAFKEDQMRYFAFLPINKIDGKLTLAIANPANKKKLKEIIEQKFPDLDVVLVDFTMAEFNRFMKEFYKVIKEKYDSIISRQSESEQNQQDLSQHHKEQVQAQNLAKPENKEMVKHTNKAELKALPVNVPRARTELPPNMSANIPSDVRQAVREKLKTLDPTMLEEAIMAICVEDFHSIWGIEVPRADIFKYHSLITRAKDEILDKDYAFIKIENLVGDFSLEIVVNQEKLVVMLKTLSEIAQKKQTQTNVSAPANNNQQVYNAPPVDDEPVKEKSTESICEKCGVSIPAEIEICSKCSRENDHKSQNEDVRSPASPSPLANLNEGHLLIPDTLGNRVLETNEGGQIVWQIANKNNNDLIHPYSAMRLRSGTTLISDSEGDRIIEFTKSGRIYWELKNREGFRDLFLRRPVQAIRLLNGNTLIADQGNHRVFEVNHLDKIVWQYGTTATVGATDKKLYSPSYIQRLSNGHTLITDTDNHRIIEIDENDEIFWQYGNSKNRLGSGYGSAKDQLNSPMFAYKLDNGNTLVVDTGNNRIIEVNQDKQVTWHFATSMDQGCPININALKAYRLKTGHTVIISPEQVIEVGAQGQLIYIRQIEYLAKSPEFKEETISQEEDKIINDRMTTKTHEKARQATSNYVKNMSNLTEIEVALVDRANHKISIVNRYKNIIWRFGESSESSENYLERPQYVELIKDEYVYVADTDNHRVIKIYRPTKEIVWTYGISGAMGSGNNQLGHPRSAVQTPDNNVLITDQYSSRVIEVNLQKEILWTYGGWEGGNNLLNAPYYAERLINNNTLITDWSNHTVIEVDMQGNILWKYGTDRSSGNKSNQLMYPEKATRTSDNTTLIADARNNRVIEINDANRIIWEFMNYKVGNSARQLSSPSNVTRLDNGNTVIVHSSNKQIIEVNKNSEVVWQYQLPIERK
ncbi:MAG: hypothetical protein H7263_05320 [Candidatus Sericytochromatia bacterium]|nr:hypothetical protein [Candidatus Sericytochromatia bacterium]